MAETALAWLLGTLFLTCLVKLIIWEINAFRPSVRRRNRERWANIGKALGRKLYGP